MPSNSEYTHNVIVVETDIDESNHVNNVVYLQYAQDIATAHWESVASPELQEKVIWVARRHEIDYLKQALLGDKLVIKTRVGEYTAATWERHYEMFRESDGQLLVRAKSVWVPLDRNTHRVKRIEGEILCCFLG
jgi:acyl-CoA thioester hydrolase